MNLSQSLHDITSAMKDQGFNDILEYKYVPKALAGDVYSRYALYQELTLKDNRCLHYHRHLN